MARPKRVKPLQEKAVAYLWSRKWKQSEIAKDLGLTVKQVESALILGEKEGWLVRKPLLLRNRISPEDLDELESVYDRRPDSINRLVQEPLKEIRVVLGKTQVSSANTRPRTWSPMSVWLGRSAWPGERISRRLCQKSRNGRVQIEHGMSNSSRCGASPSPGEAGRRDRRRSARD